MKYVALIFKVLITLPVIAFLFFLTLSNREQELPLTWSPLSGPVTVSLPIVIFAGLVLGFIWGSLILWSNTLELRAERRALKKKVMLLEKELETRRLEYARALSVKKEVYVPPPTPRIAAPEIL